MPDRDVHVIVECEGTLVHAPQLFHPLSKKREAQAILSTSAQAILSTSLIDLLIRLIRSEQLASVTIIAHQDIQAINARLSGFGGIVNAESSAQCLPWNIAKSLKTIILNETEQTIDVHVCLKPDIYPPPATPDTPDPQPHRFGNTAAILAGYGKSLIQDSEKLKDSLGEAQYVKGGFAEPQFVKNEFPTVTTVTPMKTTQLAFVLKNILTLQPDGVRQVLYFDNTKTHLVQEYLPTQEWLMRQLDADQRQFVELRAERSRATEGSKAVTTLESKISTLNNRLKILVNAPAVDGSNILFQAYHFRHELEQPKVGDPALDTFNLMYSSAPIKPPRKESLRVDDIITTIPVASSSHDALSSPQSASPADAIHGPTTPTAKKSGNIAPPSTPILTLDVHRSPIAWSAEQGAILRPSPTQTERPLPLFIGTYFGDKNRTGKFQQYLDEREKTYAWQDYWSIKVAYFLSCFGYQTEQAKRREFIAELTNLVREPDASIQDLRDKVKLGQKTFAPRATPGTEQYRLSLKYCLNQFELELETIESPKDESTLQLAP